MDKDGHCEKKSLLEWAAADEGNRVAMYMPNEDVPGWYMGSVKTTPVPRPGFIWVNFPADESEPYSYKNDVKVFPNALLLTAYKISWVLISKKVSAAQLTPWHAAPCRAVPRRAAPWGMHHGSALSVMAAPMLSTDCRSGSWPLSWCGYLLISSHMLPHNRHRPLGRPLNAKKRRCGAPCRMCVWVRGRRPVCG